MSYKIRNKTTGEILINNVFYLLRENDGRMQVFEIFSAGSKHNKIDFETLLRTDLEVVFENEKILHGESRASSRLVEIERLAKENSELKSQIENFKNEKGHLTYIDHLKAKCAEAFMLNEQNEELRKENERMKTKVDQYANKISEILADKEIYINENLKLKNEKIEKFENFEILKNEKIENLKIIEKKNRKIQNLQKRLKNKWEIIKDFESRTKNNIEDDPAYKQLQFHFNRLLEERKQLKSDVTNLCQENKSLLDRKILVEESYEALRKASRENTLNHLALIGKLEEQLKAKDKEIEGLNSFLDRSNKAYNEIEKEMQSLKAGKVIENNHVINAFKDIFDPDPKTSVSEIDKNLAEMINSGQSEILKAILKKQYGA